MCVVAFTIGRVAVIRYINETLQRQFRLQGAQHAQATHTAVKDTDGARTVCCYVQGI